MRTSFAATAIAALLLAALVPAMPASAAELAVTGVVSLDGVGVASTEVGWFDPTTGATGETVTGADGSYALTVADGHQYVLYAGVDHTATGRWLALGGDTYLPLFVGASGVDYLYQSLTPFVVGGVQNIALARPGSIKGKVAGLAKQRVQLKTLQGNVVAKVRASSTGRYEFTGLIPGRYRVLAFNALEAYEPYESGDLTVVAGTARRHNPRLIATGTVTGVVTIAGKPAKGVFVSVADVGTENGTVTNAAGRYTVDHVPTGKASLMFYGQGASSTADYNYARYSKTATVSVTSRKKSVLNVKAPKPTLFVGSVTPTAGAKSLQMRLVDKNGNAAVDHYVKVGSKKGPIAFSLEGIRAGTYTLVVTDTTKKRYTKKKVTLKYGTTTSIGAIRLKKKTLTLSGAIVGSAPFEVAFVNAYGIGSDVTVANGSYRLTGLVPGKGYLRFNAGGRSAPKPYFTADSYYTVNLRTSTTRDVSNGGPEVGLFTGTVAVGTLPIATSAYLRGETRTLPVGGIDAVEYNEAYVKNGTIVGEAESDGATTYTLGSNYNGWPKEFITGAPFWFDIPGGSVTITTKRGTTVDIGTIQLEVRR